ncbi:hypothetical protein [Paracoccus sp. N5]|uniref:hypothetical protein n=1 Tax=Paracoccus sp. N5 TaxID=1101189 RepID=UPI00037786D7|nr:hypothetical protein [Paracoccus sp. N5]
MRRPRPREAQLRYTRFLRHSRRPDQAFRAHDAFMQGWPFSAQGFFERGLIFEARPALYGRDELSPRSG